MPMFVIGNAPSYGGCDWPTDANSCTPVAVGDRVVGVDLITSEHVSGDVSAVTFVFDGECMTAHAVVEDMDGTRHDLGDRPVLVGPFAALADSFQEQPCAQ